MSSPGIFAKSAEESVSSLGEEELIRRIRLWLGKSAPPAPFGMGDDCAVIPKSRARMLLTVDPVVHGVHFDDTVSPQKAGAKLLKRNLSDIAAMGGKPTAAVIALGLDSSVSTLWLEKFYRGLALEALRYGLPVVGGDITRLPGGFAATLTLLGSAPHRVLSRKGARARDWIYVTGELGRSLPSGHHHRFKPRLAEGRWLAGRKEVRSMIDVSDGLAKDLPALCPAKCEPKLLNLPLRRGASIKQALCDGEDYELLFTVRSESDPQRFEERWARAFPSVPLTRIGHFVPKGKAVGTVPIQTFSGYEHLR